MQISKKCSIAIHCLVFMAQYAAEKKVTSELLSLSTGCNPVTIRNILSALKKAGIIEVPFGTGGAKLALPAEEITLLAVCRAVEPQAIQKLMGVHTAPSPLCPVGRSIKAVLSKTYQAVQQDFAESLRRITLQQVLQQYAAVSAAERAHEPHKK